MNTAHTSLFVVLMGVAGALVSSSCAPKPAPKKHFATCAATQPEQPPIVVLSQAGPPLPRPGGDPSQPVREEDRLVFAAWSDCAVVFREGPALKIGHVPAERIDELLSAIRDAGFFKPPLDDGLLFPDGPEQTLAVRDAARQRTLSHYGPSDDWLRENIARTGPNANPSREQMTAFMSMWDKIVSAMGAVHPADASPYGRDRLLRLRN